MFQTADKIKHREMLQTGITPLDSMLGGGLELCLTYLLYGGMMVKDILHRIAVHAHLPKEQGGLGAPVIIIDSNNMLSINRLTDLSYQEDLEPEYVLDNTFISRAFNSNQTYDLVMNQLDSFFERVPAQLLLLPGLADIYYGEGVDAEGKQHLTHMAHRVMTFSLQHNVATIITGSSSERFRRNPAAGHGLKHSAQVHIYVEETKDRIIYNLLKHPMYPVKREQEDRPNRRIALYTPPLSFFIDGLEEKKERSNFNPEG